MDQMKDYKQLIRELPSNTIVCAVGEFNPPTVGHELLVKTVKKLAEQKGSAHVIYTSPSKNSLIQEDKKEHYLNLMFPKTKFKSLNESKLQEVITELHKKYKKIILVVGTDQITEMRKLQNVELIPVDKDPEADNTKMKQFASKGIYEEFKKKLPSTIRDIDGKRLMNEMRAGLGLEPIKEQIVFVKNKLREKYFRGEIFNEGDIVESNGEKFTIVKRGSNHLLLKEANGKLVSKWIQDVKPTEEKEMNESSKLAEGAIQPNGTDKIDTKTSEPMNSNDKTADVKVKKGVITFYNYSKAQKIQEQDNPVQDNSAAKEVAKANLIAKHAKEKQSLADKQSREKESLSEAEYTGKGAGKPGWMLRADPKLALALKAAKKRKKYVAGTPSKEYLDKMKSSIKESHVEFRIDNRDKVSGDHKSTFSDHEAKVSDTTDKATYVKVPSHKADAFKTAMKSKHGVRVELAESALEKFRAASAEREKKHDEIEQKRKEDAAQGKENMSGVIDRLEKTLNKEEATDHYKQAENHLDKATEAKRKGDMFSHHMHLADHHDSMAQWHYSKGRTSAGDRHADKAAGHEEAAHDMKEHVDLEERAKIRKKFINGQWVVDLKNTVSENYDQTIEVATPDTTLETSEEDDIDDAEIEAMIGDLSDEEIMNEYGEDELGLVDDETGEEIPKCEEEAALDEQALMEVLSRAERMKAKFRIRRTASKRERATKIALKRYSNTATINKRARRLAITLMKKRLLRGRDASKLSVGEKERIERTIEKRKAVIGRIATRLAPRVRKVEKARMSHTKYTQGSQPSVF